MKELESERGIYVVLKRCSMYLYNLIVIYSFSDHCCCLTSTCLAPVSSLSCVLNAIKVTDFIENERIDKRTIPRADDVPFRQPPDPVSSN
jgi:hypothetical protein